MNGRENEWSHWLVQWTDSAGDLKETACANIDVAYDTAAKCDGLVCGVRRRSELRQGQPAYETVPVDENGVPQ